MAGGGWDVYLALNGCEVQTEFFGNVKEGVWHRKLRRRK